ncbi:MAG TPA: FkbM family methyltransferase [Acidimicrobiales bacterium]
MGEVDVVEFVDVDVQWRGAVTFALDPTDDHDPIATWLRTQPAIANEPIDVVLTYLAGLERPGRFVDVGAHLGTHALSAATGGHDVIAIEASPRNAQLMRLAAAHAGLDRIEVHNVFASSRSGTVPFLSDGPWGRRAEPAVVEAGYPVSQVRAVAVHRLLTALRWPLPDLVKIDVEGVEPLALAGMRPLLERDDAPAIVVESNPLMLEAQGGSVDALLGVLEKYGYELHLIDRTRTKTLVPIGSDFLQTDLVEDVLATKHKPALEGWTIARRLTHGDLLERVLTTAASELPESRLFAARVLRHAPYLVRHAEGRLALRTLAQDTDDRVRAAAGNPI